MIEWFDANPRIDVLDSEFVRLLGYPAGHELSGRALELAALARAWYAGHGSAFVYAREAGSFAIDDHTVHIGNRSFTSARLRRSLGSAGATSAVIVAVSAGADIEHEAQIRWKDEKPDEYFFLEVFGSAVVEALVTAVGARLCAEAERRNMAALPYYSPGYPEWDILDQAPLLEVLRDGHRSRVAELSVMDSGMLRPKKSLLAVFGLTPDREAVSQLPQLNPCSSCALPRCAYRRTAYGRPRARWLAGP